MPQPQPQQPCEEGMKGEVPRPPHMMPPHMMPPMQWPQQMVPWGMNCCMPQPFERPMFTKPKNHHTPQCANCQAMEQLHQMYFESINQAMLNPCTCNELHPYEPNQMRWPGYE